MEKQKINNLLVIDNLPIKVKKKLVNQINRLCEKQYRKGIQHGVTFYDEGLLNVETANKFRHQGMSNHYKKPVNPLNFKIKYTEEYFNNLMLAELNMKDTDELRRVLDFKVLTKTNK